MKNGVVARPFILPCFYQCQSFKIGVMNVLLHICCAPCAIHPVETLRFSGHQVTGFFFNHNIHPYQEYRKRLEALRSYAEIADLPVLWRDEYLLEEFLAATASTPDERCLYCYSSRLERTAREASESGYEAFTSTLLYSRYQQHEVIRAEGERVAELFRVRFLYEDFRPGWRHGIDASRQLGLYRQQYCGCIYSEKDRYAPKTGKTGAAP